MEGMSEHDDPVEVLRRWEDFGAVWQVVARTPEQLTISLRRCDADEEVSRLVSGDPALREYVDAQAPVERAD
jgi:hypothetical protein